MYNQPSHEIKCDSMPIMFFTTSAVKDLENFTEWTNKLQKIINREWYMGARRYGSFFCNHDSKHFSILRANVSMHQTNSGKSPEFVFTPTFIICNLWCSFFVKIYFSFREIIFFVRPLKYANFHREYYPSCVTSCNECTGPAYFSYVEK